MVLCSRRFCIVKNYRKTMTGSLRQFHVALDDRLKYQFLEVAFHLVVYLACQTQTTVVHCEQESLNLELRVQFALDNPYSVKEFADAFKAKYSHCTGIITESAAVRAFTVISPSDGEQSIRI